MIYFKKCISGLFNTCRAEEIMLFYETCTYIDSKMIVTLFVTVGQAEGWVFESQPRQN